jgi:L-malate glycosyltransferase
MNKNLTFIAPGNSIHSFKWISSIAERYDGDIYWITFFGADYSIPGVKQIEFERNVKGMLHAIFFIKKHVKGIIHIHSLGFHLVFFLLSKLAIIKNKVISTPWGSDLIFGRSSFIKLLMFKHAFKNSSLITCDAIFMKKLIVDIYPLAKVKVVYFGIDTDQFSFQERVHSKSDPFKLLSTRGLEEVYNIESIIKMMYVTSQKGMNVQLSIYADGSLRDELQRMVSDLHLNDKILFFGKYEQNDLVNILAKHDAYISMSRSDAGIASSTAEAMATGMVCLVSDVAENSLWISNNVSGFLVHDNDHKELARSIESIVEGKLDILDIGVKAREKIVTCNSIDGEMSKMNNIYLSIEKISV